MHHSADTAVPRSSSDSARSGKSLQSLHASLAGADTSRGTPCELLKSAFRRAAEAHGDDVAFHAKGSCGGSVALPARGISARNDWCYSLWQASQSGWQAGFAQEAAFFFFSSEGVGGSARNVCAEVGGDNRLSFSDLWSFGTDDQGRSVAVASAALSGDLESLKDIFESDDCSIFI